MYGTAKEQLSTAVLSYALVIIKWSGNVVFFFLWLPCPASWWLLLLFFVLFCFFLPILSGCVRFLPKCKGTCLGLKWCWAHILSGIPANTNSISMKSQEFSPGLWHLIWLHEPLWLYRLFCSSCTMLHLLNFWAFPLLSELLFSLSESLFCPSDLQATEASLYPKTHPRHCAGMFAWYANHTAITNKDDCSQNRQWGPIVSQSLQLTSIKGKPRSSV